MSLMAWSFFSSLLSVPAVVSSTYSVPFPAFVTS